MESTNLIERQEGTLIVLKVINNAKVDICKNCMQPKDPDCQICNGLSFPTK